MALASAAAAAVVLMAMASQLSAAAAAAVAAPIGLPGCDTTCGNVSVPYPFGFGHPDCYWPGLNLTCDRRHHPPRLLLGDGSLRVAEISLSNKTVRVVRIGAIKNTSGDLTSDGRNVLIDFGSGIQDYGYLLSARNELVVSGCNVMATLSAFIAREETYKIVGGCASLCVKSDGDNVVFIDDRPKVPVTGDMYCTGISGCCLAPLTSSRGVPNRVQIKWLYSGNHTVDQPALTVFVAEQGWVDMEQRADGTGEVPFLLDFGVDMGWPQVLPNSSSVSVQCPQDVRPRVCKSEHSSCNALVRNARVQGYTCNCDPGYDGNPYLDGGCQDINECDDPALLKTCLDMGGSCFNYVGGYECRCPPGMHGDDFYLPGGCVVKKSPTPIRLIIGLSAASGPALLLILGILFLLRKLKQRRIKLLKQKYFKLNRGQLLQQLLSQRADIAEKMIIPLDELVKATNNFDTTREIGGGGHGTVYKGILSDLHVVAIKKSKIAMQKEIDEFINEVAILSQINHKNVVKLFGCCLETEVPLLVYEFIPNGTLYHHLHINGQERSLSWSTRLRIATEIATSLAYLHSSVSIPIIHRDIKSSNILLDDTMTSKISDFGASKYVPIDNTGLTTRIQGTFGYLDPECFQTGRLTEKSDVYSFGVILVELLTRNKPTSSHLSNEYGGLVPHFLNLLASGNLVQIMDPQVLEEGGTEVQEVVMLAASCINIRGEERPTMRHVELTLEGLQQGSNKKYNKNDIVTEEFVNGSIGGYYPSWTSEGQRLVESSRRYSLEQEMMMSARYPR